MALVQKTSEILLQQMSSTNSEEVASSASTIVNAIQDFKTANQLLGVASVLAIALNKYGLSAGEVLETAHNYIYHDTTMKHEFRAIKGFMSSDWAI